jgi:hypothetical protein
VIEITQRRHGYLSAPIQAAVDRGDLKPPPPHDFWFRGGCMVLVDLDRGEVRYCIGKGVANEDRLETQRRFLNGTPDSSLYATYFGDPRRRAEPEPFAVLHHSL